MERRVLLAISLSFLVLFLYQQFFVPARPTQTPTALNVTGDKPANAATPNSRASGADRASNASPASVATPPAPVNAVVADTDERTITIETQKVRAVFTNRGARLRHWVLKEYRDESGAPLDLVPENIPPNMPLPFSLRVDDPLVTTWLNETLYRPSASGDVVDATTANVTVSFEMETADGVRARKTFGFEPASYLVSFTAEVQRGGEMVNPIVEWGPGLGDEIARTPPGSFFSPSYIYHAQAIYYRDGDVEREAANALGTGVIREGAFRWAGGDDHYFISAVVQPPAPIRVEYVPVTIPAPTQPPQIGRYVSYAVRFPSPPQGVKFYFGPKQLDVLRAVDPEFTKAIYFGLFAPLAAPLLGALKWVNGFVGNWGWSIIVLTILINLAMFPLRHMSVVSMRRMQELQPQMKAIQERYAKYKITDPERQKMNQEVMELYRSKGVNPMSGCLPMLMTLPFLFAFYAMLSQAIEIRGAEFGGWITDLSRYDPLYITPLLMGLTMFWQQKITPSTADPTQQKVMMIMPFMFTFMLMYSPSGLVIYWLVSNLWGIGQQYFTNYLIGPPKVHTIGPKDPKGTKGTKDTKDAKDTKDTKSTKERKDPKGPKNARGTTSTTNTREVQ